MLTRTASLIAAVALGMSAAGCAMSNRAPVTGFVYTDANSSQSATSNDVGAKRGEACATSILGIVGTGDASTTAAAHAGGITKISHVDTTNMGILGVYAESCTVVYGN